MGRSAATTIERRYQVSGARSCIGLILLDPDGNSLFASEAACELLGCDPDGLTAAWANLHAQFETTDEHGDDGRLQRAVSSSGATLQCEVIALDGGPLMGSAVLLREAAAEPLPAELFLASRMRAQSYLFNALLRDLRAPLHALEINLELLDDSCRRTRADQAADAQPAAAGLQAQPQSSEPSPPSQSGYRPATPRPDARAWRQSGQIVAALKEELARLNRALRPLLEHGATLLPMLDDVDLAALLRELAVLLRPQARQQRVAIELELAEAMLLVHGQRDQLRQALLNIAINALEAMPDGGVLTLRLSRAGAQARVVVGDSGPGLPSTLLAGGGFDSRRASEPDGRGIGLLVAGLIARGHGGALEVTNRGSGGASTGAAALDASGAACGSGAEVTLVLPVAMLRAVRG